MNKAHFNQKHGMRKTRFYRIWIGMKTRCTNKNHVWYKHYGARGITVCESWKTFENFMRDMLKTYELHVKKYGEYDTTLDRKNADDGYSKKNCSWATRKEQSNNARNNIKIEYRGETKTLIEWSKQLGMSYGFLWNRLYDKRYGKRMSPEQAFQKKLPVCPEHGVIHRGRGKH